ncbi:hypothetical protein RHSIM_Rhsim03G0182600 [Rhododendron simsii]|uniref:Disease resistance R13L4/SHOC-2-like LRR domain-containing protein n=1 Tax=Rhododendron simsii TaxID=118357 RepID=A0A834H940_RHOSS|nr:hypothetical protein RHSIM_Rhsim03G0182600 [Rhododendron simsii]
MTSLRYLNLSNSNFSGRVPHHLGNVSNLMVLDLSINTGWFIIDRGVSHGVSSLLTIDDFTWVSRLSSLQYLDASGMNLSRALNLNVMLNMLPCLTELRLSSCELYSTLLVSPFYLNSTASNIRKLDLRWNSFTGEFPKFIENLTALRVLDLSFNHLNSSFPLYLENLKSLEHLNLAHNSFTDDAVVFSRLLLTQCTLKSLDISYNRFKGQMSRSYGNLSGSAMYNLEKLILRSNRFISGNLPDWLGQFKHLKHLDLSWNSFSGSIPQSLGTLSALEVLRINGNQLNETIPVSLGQLSNLKILDLSSNHLEGVVTEANFANLTILEELSIDSNLLTLKVISDWMPPFQVKTLSMGSCKIGTTGFPQWLRTQKKVSFLDISNASISGTLPQWLDEMPLETLDLSHNLIGGPIFQKLPPTLWELDLSDNLISGPLPQNISGMVPRLETLVLAGNLISGLIPYSLWEIPALRVLDLSKNKLFGNLPRYKGWGALSALRVMRLSSNKLSGILPSSIGNFTSLEWLHLNNNSFYGELPSTLKNCTSLMVLDLGDNRFSGSIPTWIGDLIDLKVCNALHRIVHDGPRLVWWGVACGLDCFRISR